MSLTLSSDEVRRLQDALRTLAAPFAFADLTSWSNAATQSCAAALGAHQALFGMMSPDRMVIVAHGEHSADAVQAYTSHYWRYDYVITERRFKLGRETYHRDMLYLPGEIKRCVVYNEWSLPNRFCDTIGMSVESSNPMLAGVHFYHDTESGDFRERGVDLLDLLLPAFKAGVYAWLSLPERRHDLSKALESAGQGLLITDFAGQPVDEGSSLRQTLDDEPERERIRAALIEAATTVAALATRRRRKSMLGFSPVDPLIRELSTARGRYRIVATYVPEGMLTPGPAAAVILTRLSPRALSDAQLREQFGLTKREIEVARLIAAGHGNDAIRIFLQISGHTALHHTERVMRKLGVHSRSAVAAVLSS